MSRKGHRRLLGVLGATVLSIGTVATAVAPADATVAAHIRAQNNIKALSNTKAQSNVKDVCGTPKPGFERCFAQARTDVHEPMHIGRTPSCDGDYQCDAVAGYDGPTGMGTPNGLSAF